MILWCHFVGKNEGSQNLPAQAIISQKINWRIVYLSKNKYRGVIIYP